MITATQPDQRSQSNFQQRVHAPFAAERERLLDCLRNEADELWRDFLLEERQRVINVVEAIEGCCRKPTVQWSEEQGRMFVMQQRCRHRLCPLCQRQRSYDVQRKLTALVAKCDSPRFLTLTLQSSDEPLAAQMKRLTTAFARLRRSKVWKATQQGGCYTIECTFNHARQQWHPHIHAVLEGKFIEHARLKEAWQQASEGSTIVDIRLVKSRMALVKYLAKYIAKSNSVTHVPDDRVWEWAQAVRGLRMVGTFGILHGIKIDKPELPEFPQDAEEVADINSLIAHSQAHDIEATQLLDAIRQVQRYHSTVLTGATFEGDRPDERAIVERLRAWRSHIKELDDHELAALHDSNRVRGPDKRTLWQWQKLDDCGDDLPV